MTAFFHGIGLVATEDITTDSIYKSGLQRCFAGVFSENHDIVHTQNQNLTESRLRGETS
jgi:hypothetical protein